MTLGSDGRPRWLCAWLMLAALALAGCGNSGLKRYPVAGTVTYQGNKVEYGTIVFQPDASVGPIAPTGYARIEHGEFRTPPDQSPTAGLYNVRVMGFDKAKMKTNVPPGEPVETPSLFPDYTQTVEIPVPAGRLDIDVPASTRGSRR